MICRCPYCQAPYSILPEHIGLTSVCQKCRQNFEICEVNDEKKELPGAVADSVAAAPLRGTKEHQGSLSNNSSSLAGSQSHSQSEAKVPTAVNQPADSKTESLLEKTPSTLAADSSGGPAIGVVDSSPKPLSRLLTKKGAKKESVVSQGATQRGAKSQIIIGAMVAILVLVLVYFFKIMPLNEQITKLTEENMAIKTKIKAQINGSVAELKSIQIKLQSDIDNYTAELEIFSAQSAYYQVLSSVIVETKLLNALILERITALETGAPMKTVINRTEPNPELANQLAEEIQILKAEISSLETELEADAVNLVNTTLKLTIQTKRLVLVTIERNYLTAKYGLNIPYQSNIGGAATANRPAEGEGEAAPSGGPDNGNSEGAGETGAKTDTEINTETDTNIDAKTDTDIGTKIDTETDAGETALPN